MRYFQSMSKANVLSKTVARLGLLSAFMSISAFSQAEDDVFLAELKAGKVVSVKNVSNRTGYDNQPHFTPDSNGLLFSAMYKTEEQGDKAQTDFMYHDINKGGVVNFSNSAASEYSPTITPDGKHVSMIRVGDDGKQLLWQYPFDLSSQNVEKQGTSLKPNVFDVGYHVWINPKELLVFMLGEPMTLQRLNLQTDKLSLVDNNIGRTLRKVPNKDLFSYTKLVNDRWLVKLYNPMTKGVKNAVLLPSDNMYYAWHQDGRLLSAQDNVVKVINSNVFGDKWRTFADFSTDCKGQITRMVMSNNSQYLAFVCHTEDKQK